MTASLQHPTLVPPTDRMPGRDRALVLGVPLAWALLLLVHPTGDGTIYDAVDQRHTAWMAVHLGMAVFIPLMALAVHRLLQGLHSPAARVSRIALPIFAVTYGAFEAVMGIGTGGVVSAANDTVATADRVALVDSFAGSATLAGLEHIASLACGVALVAAAFALQRARRIGGRLVAVLVLATPLIAMHVPPFGPIGLVLFAAVAQVASRRCNARDPDSAV
jgi:hypothetical protein